MFLSLVCDLSYGLHDKKKYQGCQTPDIFYDEQPELLPASEQESSFRGKREAPGDQA